MLIKAMAAPHVLQKVRNTEHPRDSTINSSVQKVPESFTSLNKLPLNGRKKAEEKKNPPSFTASAPALVVSVVQV